MKYSQKLNKTNAAPLSIYKTALSVSFCAGLLSACGSDGAVTPTNVTAGTVTGGSSASPTTATVPDPSAVTTSTTPPAFTSITLNGIAATDAAMASATINAKCAVGSGTSLSNAEGAYSITIQGGQFPCVVKAKSADETTELHAAAETSSLNLITANITPLTELVLTKLHGTAASDLFANLETHKEKINNINLAVATDKIRTALTHLTTVPSIDPHKAVLVAANGSITGNAHDKVLDALRDSLAKANIKLSDLATLIAKTPDNLIAEAVRKLLPVTPTTPTTSTPLPPVATCASLKSGIFQVVEPASTNSVYTLTVDTARQTVTSPLGTEPYTNQDCLLKGSLSGTNIALGPQGAGVMRTSQGTLAAVFPKQDVTLAELQGNWTYVSRGKIVGTSNTNYSSSWGRQSIDNSGRLLSREQCTNSSCQVLSTTSTYTKNSDGSFSDSSGRHYVFKAASGAIAMISIATVGGDKGILSFAVKGLISDLPLVGQEQNSYEIMLTNTGLVDSNFQTNSFSVSENFLAGNTYKRTRSSDCRLESYSLDRPFTNLLMRNASLYSACQSNNVSGVDNTIATSVKGMGLSVAVSVMGGHMSFIVER